MFRLLALLLAVLSVPPDADAQDVPEDFRVTLERVPTGCYPCPEYSVSIDARGEVTYHGTRYVRVEGRVISRIPVTHVRALLSRIEALGFFDLRDHYVSIRMPDGSEVFTTHLRKAFVTVTRNGRTKRIEDYMGAPEGLGELERQIDEVAHTQRWVRIDVPALRQMIEAGDSLSADALAELLRQALYADEVDVVRALLESGADAHMLRGNEHTGPTRPLTIVRSAAAARALIEAGADPSAPDEFGQTPMLNAIRLPPEVAGVLLEAFVPVDMAVDSSGHTALMRAAAEGNSGVVRVLLQAGANPLLRVGGQSALDLARGAKEDAERQRLPPVTKAPFEQDFDAVIAELEEALARPLGRAPITAAPRPPRP